MQIEFERESSATPTSETNRFLGNLQQDANKILARKQELGLQVKTVLAARAHEFAELGYFGRIPTTDFLWSRGNAHDEEDENAGELGLVVHIDTDPPDGYTSGGIIMTPDGVLLKSYANDGLGGQRFSFDFESAKEVPLEDYPKYFDEAVEIMRYVTDERTGVHAAEFRRKRAERLAKHIQEIEDDNQRYGMEGAEFTGESKTVAKANEFMQHIAVMHGMVAQGDRGITTEQLENLLGHVFAAQEYSDLDNHLGRGLGDDVNGAQELVLMAGILISPQDVIIGRRLHSLTSDMWNESPSSSSYLVRRANQVQYRDNPENEKIYAAMAVNLVDRHNEGAKFMDIPEYRQPPAEITTERYGTVSLTEITDWLLNQPVSI